jgi:hypothetical protein
LLNWLLVLINRNVDTVVGAMHKEMMAASTIKRRSDEPEPTFSCAVFLLVYTFFLRFAAPAFYAKRVAVPAPEIGKFYMAPADRREIELSVEPAVPIPL